MQTVKGHPVLSVENGQLAPVVGAHERRILNARQKLSPLLPIGPLFATDAYGLFRLQIARIEFGEVDRPQRGTAMNHLVNVACDLGIFLS